MSTLIMNRRGFFGALLGSAAAVLADPPARKVWAIALVDPYGREVSGDGYARRLVTESDLVSTGGRHPIRLVDFGVARSDWGLIHGARIYQPDGSVRTISFRPRTVMTGDTLSIATLSLSAL